MNISFLFLACQPNQANSTEHSHRHASEISGTKLFIFRFLWAHEPKLSFRDWSFFKQKKL